MNTTGGIKSQSRVEIDSMWRGGGVNISPYLDNI